MEQQISRASLLHELCTARVEWDALMAEVGERRMTEPGAVGDWSVKDVMAHLTSYSRWFVNASEAHFRGEPPPLDGTEGMDFEQRNLFWHQQTRDRLLAEVQAESQQVFRRLLEVVEAHSEEFLTQPQQFEGVPAPLLVWKMLEGDIYEHYREHIRTIRAWLEQSAISW
ncbi:MAG: maleylpyruvate isomerase N-terminal domain-containing protein [Roseiflexaceae bacterium]